MKALFLLGTSKSQAGRRIFVYIFTMPNIHLPAWATPFVHCPVYFCFCFCFTSFTAALMASSASMLQWSFTGGRFRWFAISLFLMEVASSILFPLTLHGNACVRAGAYEARVQARVRARANKRTHASSEKKKNVFNYHSRHAACARRLSTQSML